MARSISVSRESGGELLYFQPLGSESAVRESWSEPASSLGLPLLASIYENGFYHGIHWSGTQLRQVVEELAKLEEHWSSSGLRPDVLADLQERAAYLREATAVAEACRGFVDIM